MINKKIIAIVMFLLMINFASASIQYYQTRENINGTLKDLIGICYTKGEIFVGNMGIEDYIKAKNPLQVYDYYSLTLQSWNQKNVDYSFDYCNFVVTKDTNVLVNETFTNTTADEINVKYFINLEDRECANMIMYCKKNNLSIQEGLDMPFQQQIVMPTWECKACQYYEWSLVEINIAKSKTIGENVVDTSKYIKKLFNLNFEILLALFWILTILLLFAIIGMVFSGIYWLYIYLKSLVK